VLFRSALADVAHLRRATVVRYEDLVGDCRGELERLQRFAGLEPHPCGPTPRAGLNDAYLEQWERLRGNPGRAVYRELIVRRFEARVAHFGYSLRHPDRAADRLALLERLLGPSGARRVQV
jgi:hypothetical protein